MVYTLIFLFVSAIIFRWYYRSGRSLIWDMDGVPQHFVSLVYFGQYLRQVASGLLAGEGLVFPMFDFSIGYGSDILTTLHYYVIGDPLNLLAVLVPTDKTEILYSFLAVFRIYLAGVSFSMYCKYMKQPLFNTLCGSFIYALSSFSVLVAVRHPFFLNPMIYLPLLFIGVEKIFNKKKPNFFIVMVFISAMSNFYFFYMLTLLIVIYAAIRFFAICDENRVKNLFKWLGSFSLYYLTGLLMACIIFLPTALLTLSTGRAGADNAIGAFYHFEFYERFLSAFITSRAPGYWSEMGYASLAFIAVIALFYVKKKNKQLKVGFLMLTIFLLLPFVGHVFNGFSYVSNRWIFGYGFLVSLITVIMIPQILKPASKQIGITIICTVLYFLQGLFFDVARSEEFFVATGVLFMLIILMYHNYVMNLDKDKTSEQRKKAEVFSKAIMFSLVILSVTIQAYYRYAPMRGNHVAQAKEWGEALRLQTENSSAVIQGLEDESFFRYETNIFGGQGLAYNASLLNRQNSVDFYFSLGNPHIRDFFYEDIYFADSDYMYRGLGSRTMPGALASVKYFVVNSGLERFKPYGYTNKVFTSEIQHVYENQYALPIGYTYDSMIPEDEYKQLSAIEKQQALLQSVVINNGDASTLDRGVPEFNHSTISYEVVCDEGISYENGSFIVENTEATVTLLFDGLEDSETYLGIYGLQFSQQSPVREMPEDEWDNLNFLRKMQFIRWNRSWQEARLSTITIQTDDAMRTLLAQTPRYQYYTGKEDYLINLFYSEDKRTEISISFQQPGRYEMSGLEVICQPMDNFGDQVDKLREVTLENVKIDTNRVSGILNNEEDKLLTLSIPYSKGWSAYINGEEVELLNVNTMYCGLYVPAGNNTVVLEYRTPYLTQGCILSLVGVCFFIAIIVHNRKK